MIARGRSRLATAFWLIAHVMRSAMASRRPLSSVLQGPRRPWWLGSLAIPGLRRDFVYAWRGLARRPAIGLVSVVILTSALAVGTTTAVSGLVYGIWLKPLPYAQPDRLVFIHDRSGTSAGTGLSVPDLEDYQAGATVFSDTAGFISDAGFARVNDERVRIVKYRVAPNLFSLLGARPALGRLFATPEAEGRAAAVILSDAFWRARFGGDAGVIGKTLMMNEGAYAIVGVMPRDFRFPELFESDVWIPLYAHDSDERGLRAFGAVGRLKPGVTVDGASAELAAIAARLAKQYPKTNTGWSADATSLFDETFGRYRSSLGALLGLVGLFFGVSCINVATLLLARTAARRTELAVRAALGASYWRLTRQFLIEGLMLGSLGGLLGIGLSAAATHALVAIMPPTLPRVADVGTGVAAYAFAALLSTATAVWYGLTPMLVLRRVPAADAIRPAQALGSNRVLGGGLIIAEITLSVVLLVGAAMMVHSFALLISQNPGFQPHGLLTLDAVLPFPRARYQQPGGRAAAFRDLVDRLQRLPGVSRVGATVGLPGRGLPVTAIQSADHPDGPRIKAIVHTNSPDLLTAMGIPLEAGRVFTNDDTLASASVAIVSHSLATQLWRGENPIGRSLLLRNPFPFVPVNHAFEVVGVVGDTHLGGQESPELYVPLFQTPGYYIDLVVRTDGDPASIAGMVRVALRAADRDIAIEHVAAMDEVIGNKFGLERAQSYLAGFVAALAAILSAVGVYGLLSYSVSRRKRELGIRLALGAGPQDLFTLVVRRALWLALTGLSIGLLLALGAIRLLRTLVFGLATPDPAAVVVASLLLITVALGAAWGPARRAFRTDPLTSIRQD